jgi:hypothetical protein
MTGAFHAHLNTHTNAQDRVQDTETKISQDKNDSTWETLTQRAQVARICALFKA